MSRRSHARCCLALLVFLLALVGLGSSASAASFIALDFGNPAGSTPPSQVFSIDPLTGVATPIGFAGTNRLNDLAISPSGELITKRQNVGFLKLDPATGATTFWAASAPNTFDVAMTFAPSGELFLTGNNSTGGQTPPNGHGLYRYDPATSQTTFVGNTRMSDITAMVFAPDGTLYGWSFQEGLVRINPLTGLASDIDPLVGPRRFDPGSPTGEVFDEVAQALAFGADGRLYGAWRSLYEIDLTAGAYTQIGGSYADIRGMVLVVPEPGTLSLVGGGLLAIVQWRRRSAARASREPVSRVRHRG